MRILACGAHADDVELACGGTLALAAAAGHEVHILDLSAGELGSNGDPETRAREAGQAARILGVAERHNAGLPDAALNAADDAQRGELVNWLRRLAPDLLLIPPAENRHPDHREAHGLLRDAAFLAGLGNYPGGGAARRPRGVYHYMERIPFAPRFVVRIDAQVARKRAALACYESQFRRSESARTTLINSPDFLAWVEARDRYWGGIAGCVFAEPFTSDAPLRVEDPLVLLNAAEDAADGPNPSENGKERS